MTRAGRSLVAVGAALGVAGVAIASYPGGYDPYGPPKALALALAGAAVALGLALDAGRTLAVVERLSRVSMVRAGVALAALVGLSAALSVDRMHSLSGGFSEYRGLGMLLLCATVGLGLAVLSLSDTRTGNGARLALPVTDGDRALVVVGRTLTVTVILVAAIGLPGYLGLGWPGPGAGLTSAGLTSTLGNASNLGVYLVLALPLLVAGGLGETRAAWRVAAWVAFLAGVAMLVATQSRGAWAGGLAAVVAAVVLYARGLPRDRKAVLFAGAAGAVLAFAILAGASIPGVASRAASAIDPGRGTAAWRASVWSSAARMAVDRPLLGWGPATFRLVFPAYRTPGLPDPGLSGRSVDDAHDLVLDTAAASGIPAALALLATLGAGGLAAWKGAAPESGRTRVACTLGASLAGGAVALSFHFLTADTGPVLVSVLAGLAVLDAAPMRSDSGLGAWVGRPARRRIVAVLAGLGFAISLAAAILAAQVLVAGDHVAGGFRASEEGRPWPEGRARAVRAQAAAPWEAAFDWAGGRMATIALLERYDAEALSDGRLWMARARARLPLDARVPAQQGDLFLAAAGGSGLEEHLDAASRSYREAHEMDPQNPVPLVGLADALAAQGDRPGARDALRAAIAASPRFEPAWAALARIYTAMGLASKARAAEATARRLRMGLAADTSAP